MERRVIAYIGVVGALLAGIGMIFWQEELQYIQPTPVPENLKEIEAGALVDLSGFGIENNKARLIHFFNYDCPCSRFNIKEFRSMVHRYEEDVTFLAVVSGEQVSTKDVAFFKDKYDLGIETIADNQQKLADYLGVYSTPQAVLITKDNRIYYKGNYNKARFCVSRNTQFVEKALKTLVANEPLPRMPVVATIAYGCSIKEKDTKSWYELF